MKFVNGFFMAWSMFSRIPCPYKKWDEGAVRAMLCMFPLTGLFIGAIVSVCCILVGIAGLPAVFAGAVLTVLYFYLTGFIHVDGFMDCSDAILSRRPELAERQRILKDSHVGAFAVISFAFMLLLFTVSMMQLCEKGFSYGDLAVLCLIFIFSRAASAYDVMNKRLMKTSLYTQMREKGSVAGSSVPLVVVTMICYAILMAVVIFCDENGIAPGCVEAVKGSVVLGIMLAFEKYTGRHARKSLGSMNGDISGLMIVSGETCALLLLVVSAFVWGGM